MPTAASLPRRLLLSLLVVGTLTVGAYATTASAAATHQPIYLQFTSAGPADPSCTGLPGTYTSTTTVQGYFVANADGTLHVIETVTNDYRDDWTDGTYLISQNITHQSFNVNATGTADFSFAEQDRGTLYSPTGQILGYGDILHAYHQTFADGTLTSVAEQFRIVRNACP